MNSDQKAILGFVLGITAGAVVGLLLAPDSGEQTRKKISDAAKSYSDDLSGQINSAISRLSNYVDKAQGEAQSAVADAKNKVQDGKDAIRASVN